MQYKCVVLYGVELSVSKWAENMMTFFADELYLLKSVSYFNSSPIVTSINGQRVKIDSH